MQAMRKGKVGLQKEVSRIFTGVQIPGKGVSETASHPPVASPLKDVPPKPITPAPQRTFTIPEPAEYTTPVPSSPVYEPSAPAPAIASAAASAPVLVPVIQPKLEPPPKLPRQIPILKIWERVSGKLLASKPGVVPARQKAMILIVPVVVVFIVVFVRMLWMPGGSAVKPTGKIAFSATAASTSKIEWELPPLYPQTLRDPMSLGTFVVHGRENVGKPAVKGIVYSEDSPSAVVGDRIVSAGDVVEGATVVKINPDSVEFAIGDKNWTQKVER
jgi:hypothetical protein